MSDIKASMKVWPENFETARKQEVLLCWIPMDSDLLKRQVKDTIPSWVDIMYLEDFGHGLEVKLGDITHAKSGWVVVVIQLFGDPRVAVEAVLSEETGYTVIAKSKLRKTRFPGVLVGFISKMLTADPPHLLEVVLRQ